jgi:hypothetical protein
LASHPDVLEVKETLYLSCRTSYLSLRLQHKLVVPYSSFLRMWMVRLTESLPVS